jgi:hypothetical protein
VGRGWKTKNDPEKPGFGDHYLEERKEYPYGTKARPGGVAQMPQPRSVDSMKAPHTPQWERGYERGLIEGKADAVKPWRAQAQNWREGYAAGVAAARSQKIDPTAPKGFLEQEYLSGRITQEQYESRRRERDKKGEKCRIENGLCMVHGYSVSPQVPCPIGGARGWNTPQKAELTTEKSVDNIEVPKSRAVPTDSVRVKKVELMRAEGLTSDPELGKWLTFDSLDDANKKLTENGKGMPQEEQGYDKHDFKVHFTDGSVYTGRYDLHRNERANIGNQMHSFSGYMAKKSTAKQLPFIKKQDRWAAAYMHKITDKKHLAPVSEKVKPESLESMEAREREYWKGMEEAEEKARKEGKDGNAARVEYARLHGKKRDLSPDIYRTHIGHYGGLHVEVPEEKFEGFKSHFPAKEFPRKVDTDDYRDAEKHTSGALERFHKTFPNFSGKTRTVFFADGSKGARRLDFYELPSERENPGGEMWMAEAFKPEHKGALHRQLGISEDQKIGKTHLHEIVNTPDGEKWHGHTVTPLMKKRAQVALNANPPD